ncbi:phosphate transporter, partial [Bacillus cereus]
MKESVYQQPIEVSSGQETVINKKFNFTSNPLTGLVLACVITMAFYALGIFPSYSFMSFIGLSIVAWLAVENGGNDVSKGVA